jgi:hypothetical protein
MMPFTWIFYALQLKFYAMTKTGCDFYALQTNFWANERPMQGIMVTFAPI